MITIQAFVNIGVVSSSWPVTGVPLPFISFGGSSLVVNLSPSHSSPTSDAIDESAAARDRRLCRAAARADISIPPSRLPTRCAAARANVAFIGTADRLETTIVPKAGYPLYTIAEPIRCRAVSSLRIFRTIAAQRTRNAAKPSRCCAPQRPDLVIATGGYVCFPVALAARIRAARAPLSRADRPARAQRVAGFDESAARADRRRGWGGDDQRSDTRLAAALAAARGCDRRGSDSIRRARRSSRSAEARARARSTTRCCASRDRTALPAGWQLLHLTGESDYERVAATSARRRTRASSCAPISTTWPTRTPSPICC